MRAIGWVALVLAAVACAPEEESAAEPCGDGELEAADDGCECEGEAFRHHPEETCACVFDGFACTPVDGCRGACD